MAQRYGIIAAHTWHCVCHACVCSVLRAHVQFAGLIRWKPPPMFSDTAITDCLSDTTLIPLFSSSELTGCGYLGLLDRIRWTPPPMFSDTAITDCLSDTTLIPLFSSSELTGCRYLGLLDRRNRSDTSKTVLSELYLIENSKARGQTVSAQMSQLIMSCLIRIYTVCSFSYFLLWCFMHYNLFGLHLKLHLDENMFILCPICLEWKSKNYINRDWSNICYETKQLFGNSCFHSTK